MTKCVFRQNNIAKLNSGEKQVDNGKKMEKCIRNAFPRQGAQAESGGLTRSAVGKMLLFIL